MATKLREFSTQRILKLIAFILSVICITTAVWHLQYLFFKGMDTESLFIKEYQQSKDFISYINQEVYKVMDGREINNANYHYGFFNGKNSYYNSPEMEQNSEKLYRAYYFENHARWVYIAFPDEFMTLRQQEWDESREALYIVIIRGLAFVFIGFMLIVYLACATGKQPQDKEIHLSKSDRIYSDLLFAVLCMSTGSIVYIIAVLLRKVSPFIEFNEEYTTAILTDYSIYHIIKIIYICSLTAVLTTISLVALLSLLRKIKAGILIKNSLIYEVSHKGYQIVTNLITILVEGRMFHGYPLIKVLFYRQQVFIASSIILVLLTLLLAIYETPFLLLPLMIESAIIYLYIKGNKLLYEDIDKGFLESIEEQMKAERMKLALITNVSHDLKTPLTSIISYVDLLSKEESLSDTAMDYVKILQDKSDRLKNIVTDLFDLAKSTSGDIDLEFDIIDMKKLIEQTVADMGDKIDASGLQIKTKLSDKSLNIYADGKKLYRVFQNVIDNALKYSMKGTRVFIELEERENEAIAMIKNIASYEMNFTAEDVLQRFTRGDNSRTTEGSGLGLSIAESFTKVCNGDFIVEIDGDMFKATIRFDMINHIRSNGNSF